MVLTDLPFERGSIIHQRYNLLRRPGSAPAFKRDEDEKKHQSKAYASFLKYVISYFTVVHSYTELLSI
jgi:hypothetical protein